MGYIKESFKYWKREPKQALKDFGMCISVFVVAWCMLFMAAILQGCTATKTVEAKGRTTIITTDTTHIEHGGNVSIKLSK